MVGDSASNDAMAIHFCDVPASKKDVAACVVAGHRFWSRRAFADGVVSRWLAVQANLGGYSPAHYWKFLRIQGKRKMQSGTSPRMSILYVEASEHWGAPERLLSALLASPLFREGVDVAAAVSSGVVYDKLAALGTFPVFPIPAQRLSKSRGVGFLWRRAIAIWRTTWQLVRLIRKLRPDFVQANSLNGAIYAAPATQLGRVPLIWHMHDILRDDTTNRVLVRFLSACSVRIIAVSEATRAALCHMGAPAGKIRVIYNGLDPAAWDPDMPDFDPAALRRQWKIPLDTTVLLHIGRITRWKGQHIFLQAARRLESPAAVFLVVGGPADHPEDQVYAEEVREQIKTLGEAGRYLSWVDSPQQAYAIADVVVHSSTTADPLPTVILEAMALGKPVIASRRGGAAEIVADQVTGLLFSPENSEELASAMSRLIEDRTLRYRMGSAAVERFRSRFTLSQQIENLINFYDGLVG